MKVQRAWLMQTRLLRQSKQVSCGLFAFEGKHLGSALKTGFWRDLLSPPPCHTFQPTHITHFVRPKHQTPFIYSNSTGTAMCYFSFMKQISSLDTSVLTYHLENTRILGLGSLHKEESPTEYSPGLMTSLLLKMVLLALWRLSIAWHIPLQRLAISEGSVDTACKPPKAALNILSKGR